MWKAPSRRLSSGIAAATAVAGCGRFEDSLPRPGFEVTCKAWQDPGQSGGCFPPNCPGNSPVINSFPINGLAIGGTGECNPTGIQLVPRSLAGGGCRSGADLTFDAKANRLIGMRGDELACASEQLTGATFLVRSARATLALTIANVRRFEVDREDFEGYRIESGGASACEPATADRVLRALGEIADTPDSPRATPLVVDGFRRGIDDDLAIAVGGPIYDERERPIPGTKGRLFSLACAGDGLAKRSLYHLYTTDDARNETALRMITASYCGRSYTLRGIKLEWASPSNKRFHEAAWRSGRALCLDTPRLVKLELDGAALSPRDLPRELQPRGCEHDASGRGTCDEPAWTKALRAECGDLAECTTGVAGDLESFTNVAGVVIGRGDSR